jgi:alpha-glucuronidase
MKRFWYVFLCVFLPSSLLAEDGSSLWLRYAHPGNIGYDFSRVASDETSPTLDIARKELDIAWKAFTGESIINSWSLANSRLVIGTGKSRLVSSLLSAKDMQGLGRDGYLIRRVKTGDVTKVVIAASTEHGVLYGVFHFLRLIATGAWDGADIREVPAYNLRILNHWDNLDRTIERGYAGLSLWKWDELPATLSPRYEAYARANASIGINATVLNNVNANPLILREDYLQKVKALAEIFRPYGIQVFLAVNFSSPKELGGLADSDPLNKDVVKWWNNKIKEVYRLIPDFGGFLVKANSEGLPGPQDYGRTHAEGANMLADALKPYRGIVMWRAFVYNPTKEDRAKQAWQEFVPLDGQFRDNVIIQIKNGPVDFQPREPFSPLFGALKKTQEMIEFQITQEYLGFSNHLVYLAPLFKETLDSDTYATGAGATIAKVTDGSIYPAKVTAIAGVANTGEDTNWCGHHFAQANWYAFGRLAWNHQLTSEQIAGEWIRMTFSHDTAFIQPVKEMMLSSREACVDYMMPLGLHHIFAFDHHYGPQPWGDRPGGRPDWMPWYYHNADSTGLGFNRTTTGSNAVSQYFPPLNEQYNNLSTCPENLLLWFHHIPWKYRMNNGLSMWDNLCRRYDAGLKQVREYQKVWDRMQPCVDEQRFREVQSKLKIQTKDALWWKDACLLYFQTFSKLPIPHDLERPVHNLEELMK